MGTLFRVIRRAKTMNKTSKNMQTCFLKACKEQFEFLTDHGFQVYAGYSVIRGGREVIVPRVKAEEQASHQAKVIYENLPISIELCLDKEQERIIFAYTSKGKELFWSDLVAVLSLDDEQVQYYNGHAFICIEDEQELIGAVKRWRAMLNPQLYLMDKASRYAREVSIDRADKLRRRIYEFAEKQTCQENKRSAHELAMEAFLKRDYLRVIEYLKPVEKDMSPTDRKMLELSIKKITDPFK